MIVSSYYAEFYIGINEKRLYVETKYSVHIVKKGWFDLGAYQEQEFKKHQKKDFCFGALNFADYVVAEIGADKFLKRIPTKYRGRVKKSIADAHASETLANVIYDYNEEFKDGYERFCEVVA